MTKLSRDAAPEEILQGDHGPVRGVPGKGDVVTNMLSALQDLMPGWNFTIFMFEPPANAAKANRLPAFNYGSTVERADMLAVLKAFILKNENPADYAKLAKLDEFQRDQSTTGGKQ